MILGGPPLCVPQFTRRCMACPGLRRKPQPTCHRTTHTGCPSACGQVVGLSRPALHPPWAQALPPGAQHLHTLPGLPACLLHWHQGPPLLSCCLKNVKPLWAWSRWGQESGSSLHPTLVPTPRPSFMAYRGTFSHDHWGEPSELVHRGQKRSPEGERGTLLPHSTTVTQGSFLPPLDSTSPDRVPKVCLMSESSGVGEAVAQTEGLTDGTEITRIFYKLPRFFLYPEPL